MASLTYWLLSHRQSIAQTAYYHTNPVAGSVAGYSQWQRLGVSAALFVSCLSSWLWRCTQHVRLLISLVSLLVLKSIADSKCWCVAFQLHEEASQWHFLTDFHILLHKQLVIILRRDQNQGEEAAEQILNLDIHSIQPDTPIAINKLQLTCVYHLSCFPIWTVSLLTLWKQWYCMFRHSQR